MSPPLPRSTLFPYTTLFRSRRWRRSEWQQQREVLAGPLTANREGGGKANGEEDNRLHQIAGARGHLQFEDRKSTRLNSSHRTISYAVFCLKKKTTRRPARRY